MIEQIEKNKENDEAIRKNFEILGKSQSQLYSLETQINNFKKHKKF